MTTTETAAGPLAGVRVLDLATERAELAGRILADLGADVLKIEPPGGVRARHLPPFDRRPGHEGDSLTWAAVGIGKRSVVADLATEAGRGLVRELALRADVLVESFDPGVMDALGLGQAALRAANPRLVYVAVTPWGQDGPYAARPATDLTIEAASGLLALQGDGDLPPLPIGYPQASFHAGAQAAADAIIALNERDHSGLGQFLDVSMQAAMEWTLMNASGYPPNTGQNPPGTCELRIGPPVELVPGVPAPPNVYPCADGYVIGSLGLGALGARTMHRLMKRAEAAGVVPEELAGLDWSTWHAEFAEGRRTAQQVNRGFAAVLDFVRTQTLRQMMDLAVEDDLVLAPCYTMRDVMADPQLAARDYWVEVAGRRHPGVFACMTRTPVRVGRPAPRLDEAAAEVREGTFWPVRWAAAPVGGPRRGAFEGLRVADFAWVGVGPLISKALADHGATVIHIESSTRPDVLRLGGPFKIGVPGIDRSQFMANFNSSKYGLAANLSLPEGRELARRVVEWADVVVESFTPGTLEKLGLDYGSLSKGRPELIMLSTCMRGQTGPERTYAGFGTQGAALAGFVVMTGWPGRTPRGPWGAYTDFIAPRYGVSALASAIYERRRSGLGQYIDLSQVEAAIHFLEPVVLDATVNGVIPGPQDHDSDRACPHGVYRCEGVERFVAIACETVEQWHGLRSALGLKGFEGAEYETYAGRLPVRRELDAVIAAWCATRDAFAIADELTAAGVPASAVLRPTDLYADPQLLHRQFFRTLEHGEMGPTPYDGLVTRFSDAPTGPHRAAPCLGQHTMWVLEEVLGLEAQEIAELAAAGVLS